METVHKFVFFPFDCWIHVKYGSEKKLSDAAWGGSDDGTFRGGQVDGLDAHGQSFLQLL